MRVIIREAAYDDLDRIHAWIAKDRPRSADAVIDRILSSAERLGQFPRMGHVGRMPGTFGWAIPRLPYIIIYRIEEISGLIFVDAIFHVRKIGIEGDSRREIAQSELVGRE